MAKWKGYAWSDRHAIPAHGGVYAIYGDGRLIYIGESDNVRLRLMCHQLRQLYSNFVGTPWGNFLEVRIKVRQCRRFGEWAMVERRLIRRLKPAGNIKGTGRRRTGG